ncbi:hypothetical protein [Saccharopolyspora shandongensis]|uniref:hypothetical protein n=1 Tax=Saccharopolyspora shandongensis TaxID=418495 RepID=UPI0033EFC4E1
MTTTRTAHVTRTKLAATAAALTGLTLMLTACGGSKTDGGAYLSITDGQHGSIVTIDGNKITYIDTVADTDSAKCNLINQALKDIENNAITPGGSASKGTYEVVSTGTINEGRTSVIWDDGNGFRRTGTAPKTGSLLIQGDQITIDYVFHKSLDQDMLVLADSDQGKAVIAKYCGKS